ncbi:MAG: elongation factor G [Planctomycetaceae bacterium]|nr:elongation factor G [Planctomycetaceae bacterium]
MPRHNITDLRNVALVGHGGVGKTTLADRMLFEAGVASRAGSVDDGTSLLDFDEEEKEHKSSISSALCHFTHRDHFVNLIDTPGHPEFIGAAVGAIRAVETAVIVVSAAAGIEVNSRRTFNLAGAAGVGRMIVLNKCGADNVNFEEVLRHCQETFGQACVPLNVPVGAGANLSSVISTLALPETIPDDVQADPRAINQQLMDAVVEADEELMTRYLEGEKLTDEEVASGVTEAIKSGTLIPLLCTSAKTGVGVPELMDALATYTLCPDQRRRIVRTSEGEERELPPDADGPLVAQVFKTRIDPFVAKMSYVRVFSGTLTKDSSVHTSKDGRAIKISQLLEVEGGQTEAVDSATPGDIVAIAKAEDLHTGTTLTTDGKLSLPPIPFPKPMIALAVEPKSRADQQKISSALQKVVEEDPTFRLSRDPQTKELVMHGMSELHLGIIQERLHRRDKVEVITHPPKIPYRETVSGEAEGSYRHKKQSGGSGQFAEVHMKISHLPRDVDHSEFFTKDRFPSMREYHYDPELNYAFVDRISGGSIPNNFIPAVEKGIRERMERGVIANCQVQDVVCELFFGKDHPVDSNETAFKMAGSLCFRNIFLEARPNLLEPIVHLEITVPDDKLGDVTSDLNTRRGRMEGMDGAPGGFQIIHARAPLSEVMTYGRSLSSMTGGQGSFTMELSHYEMVPPQEQKKIVDAATKHADEDE